MNWEKNWFLKFKVLRRKLDVNRLKTVPNNLGKLSDSADNAVVKYTMYSNLDLKVKCIVVSTPSTTRLINKTK